MFSSESSLATTKCTIITLQEPSKGPWMYNSKESSDTVNIYDYDYFNRKGDDSGPPWVYCSMQHTMKNTVKIPVGLNKDNKCVIEYAEFPLDKWCA